MSAAVEASKLDTKMSFGWSAGDLASVVKLINSIVTSLRSTSGAREQFQELETELFGLEHALEHIDSLTRAASPYSSSPEIQTLKFVSLYCVKTLEHFLLHLVDCSSTRAISVTVF